MWPAVIAALRTYAPVIVFPFAFAIGVVGYNLEGMISEKTTPWKPSTIERRAERKMQEAEDGGDKFEVPKTIFERFDKDKK